jgi:KDO2-lipid IV(A) lauroyltransferase
MTDLKTRHEVAYHAFRISLGLGSRLPLVVTRSIGRHLGVVALALGTRDRRRARQHLRIAFPDFDDQQIRRLLRGFARHVGLIAAEVAWLWRASPLQVMKLCTMEGTEHFRTALDAGRGAILVTGHCGNWEILNARLCAAGIPMSAAVRSVYDPRLDRITGTLRSRYGLEAVPRGVDAGRQLTAALNRNRVIGLLIDQDIRDVPSLFVPFFGRRAWTPSGAAALAIRHRCPTVPTFIHRRDDHTHHVVVHPPLQAPEQGRLRDKVEELTENSTALIERQIRAYPEQWVWMHRRWRTQPPPSQGKSGDVEE